MKKKIAERRAAHKLKLMSLRRSSWGGIGLIAFRAFKAHSSGDSESECNFFAIIIKSLLPPLNLIMSSTFDDCAGQTLFHIMCTRDGNNVDLKQKSKKLNLRKSLREIVFFSCLIFSAWHFIREEKSVSFRMVGLILCIAKRIFSAKISSLDSDSTSM